MFSLANDLTFYFDVGSPYAYLASERVEGLFGDAVTWQPVLLGGLFRLTGRSSWALGDYARRQRGMAVIERRARGYGLPPLRWPDPWPSDYLTAMRATTYAFAQGCGHEFTRAAFRAAFQQGTDLSIDAHVWRVARSVGLDPDAVRAGALAPENKSALRAATEAAHARGVFGVPTLAVGDELFWGDDRLDAAAAELARPAGA
jgi:2-hydroxychromene-2-carboxylate isomerase